ncbi:NAD+ synthase [Halanaerobacter jeridensis]|uniref:NH(3)-dependent NAD(+) synthetase n=1 Tax=Halanaerobacter jeridensis TaxID=706427 RepID=A0A938XR33_9FIRM|nr:NAD+ synthase [Halanaerobacter jeridensis]MBM7558027.1 NAD+ synthase [Halanaerobacter jeridensis]
MLERDYAKISDGLVNWIQNKVSDAGSKGAVVGMSGGIDSSVMAVLSKRAFPDQMLALIMPCQSNSQDKEDAIAVAEKFDIDYEVVDLTSTYEHLLAKIKKEDNKLAEANIKPRLRMTTLYYYANLNNYLVVGTDNKSELTLGYFTKYGDGGIDLAPLGDLLKTEVRELAKMLNIPERIIAKPPSAGLWAGQTDEEELGVSYEAIDKYILTGEGPEKVKSVVEEAQKKSEHKLKMPEIFNL